MTTTHTTHTTHTPAPWKMIRAESDADGAKVWQINGHHQCEGFHSPSDCQLAKVYSVAANARLIAAAPDILAALEEQLQNTEGDLSAHFENGESEADCAFLSARIAAMSAAIARAKVEA